MPCGVILSKNTDITDAHGWVFSRILYSCSAAYCLIFDAPPARRMSTDLSQTGREMHLCKSERSVGDNSAPNVLEKARERIRPQIAQSNTETIRGDLSKEHETRRSPTDRIE